jgi:epidermal growth factor receptor substrate 15
LGTTAVLGAGAAVGAAAGVVAAGASTLFSAAKEAVTGEHEEHESTEKDPFGAEGAADTATSVARTDPFGVPSKHPSSEAQAKEETDPFGAPSTSAPAQSSFESQFDHGFGDSFGAAPTHQPTSSHTDFDAAFADFDEEPEKATAEKSSEQASAEAPAENAPAPVEHFNEEPLGLAGEGIPAGIPKSPLPDLKPDVERSMSTQAVAPSSVPDSPVVEDTIPSAQPETAGVASHEHAAAAEEASSDEDEGPEDLEGPQKAYHGSSVEKTAAEPIEPAPTSASPPVLSSPVTSETAETGTQKVRRSAPPPPSAKTSGAVPPSVADFDPFGAPISSAPSAPAAPVFDEATHLPPGAAAATFAPNKSSFEDDDFDFSDLPPAQVEHASAGAQPPAVHTATSSAFDDEFANFDDEFDKPSTGQGSDGSNGMSKSYEMVSPNQPSAPFAPEASTTAKHYDEWGFGNGKKAVEPQQATGGFTFDDAFGGDFEPA